MRAHSCKERGISYCIFVPEVASLRDGESTICSRIGFEHEATTLKPDQDPLEYLLNKTIQQQQIQVIFIDEAQFLTKEQVMKFCLICDQLEIPIFAYGLRTDFKGEPFEGSKYLMSWADNIEEIATFEAGSAQKATFNQKINEKGESTKTGSTISPGFGYKPVSRKTFNLTRL